jgi:O-antigen ligase
VRDDPRERDAPMTDARLARVFARPAAAWTVSILVALMPLSFSLGWKIKALPQALLFLLGLALLAGVATIRRSYRTACPPMAVALAMIVFAIFNVLLHGLGWRPLDRPAHVLLFLVVAACFALPLRMRVVWIGFSLGAIVLGTTAMVQTHVLHIERPHGLNGGPSASIELATVLLGLSTMALVQFLAPATRRWERGLHLLAMGCAMYGALLTQSRGPLLAFAPVFLLLVLLHARRAGRWRTSLALVAAVCAVAGAATFGMRAEMVTRFQAIGPEVTRFDQSRATRGAVIERLEMWRTATRAFRQHPLAGIGVGQFDEYTRQEILAGRSHAAIGRYNQPHNEYLEAAATGGVPGLLVLLAVFLVPLYYFGRRLLDPDDEVALPAAVGVGVIGLYMLCALTDAVFYRVMTQSFYFFVVLGLALRLGWLRQAGNARPG